MITTPKHSQLRWFPWTVAAVIAVGSLISATAAAQDAKTLYTQALAEGNSCKKMTLVCQAAKADPKNKDYSSTCDSFRTAMSRSDEGQKNKAIDAINRGDLAAATRIATVVVCTADVKNMLMGQIDEAKKSQAAAAAPPPPVVKADQSSQFLAEARQAFGAGQFDAATAAAGKVTDPNLKPIADDIAGKVSAYRSAVAAARSAEASKDYAGAQGNWRTAQGISGNGPDSPASNIARLEPLAHPPAATVAVNNPPPPPPTNNTPVKKPDQPTNKTPVVVDNTAEIARLLGTAQNAERGNDLQAALHDYEAVLRLDKANGVALAGKAGVQAKINSDPAEQAKALAQAIRYFYGSKYSDAEDALRSYLDAPTAKSKGAAYFYLGATRLYEKILSASGTKPETVIASAEIQRPFKDARVAGYQPVERLVSPVVLRAWRSVQ